MQTILRALVMLILLCALCPLPIVKMPLGFRTRTYVLGPGFQARTLETFLWDSIRLASIIEGMFRPLLSGWGSFTFLAKLAKSCTPRIQPETPAEILNTFLKPSLAAIGDGCAICHDEFVDPVELSRSHKFCDKCARRTLSLNDLCPLCRQKPLPWNSQASTARPTTMWVLRCIATLLDVVFVSTLVKELAQMGLDYHSAQTVITLANINMAIALATQTFLVVFGPRTLLGRSMGLSALPDDVVSGMYSLLVVFGLLSSWGMHASEFELAFDLYRVLNAVRVFLAA